MKSIIDVILTVFPLIRLIDKGSVKEESMFWLLLNILFPFKYHDEGREIEVNDLQFAKALSAIKIEGDVILNDFKDVQEWKEQSSIEVNVCGNEIVSSDEQWMKQPCFKCFIECGKMTLVNWVW